MKDKAIIWRLYDEPSTKEVRSSETLRQSTPMRSILKSGREWVIFTAFFVPLLLACMWMEGLYLKEILSGFFIIGGLLFLKGIETNNTNHY